MFKLANWCCWVKTKFIEKLLIFSIFGVIFTKGIGIPNNSLFLLNLTNWANMVWRSFFWNIGSFLSIEFNLLSTI